MDVCPSVRLQKLDSLSRNPADYPRLSYVETIQLKKKESELEEKWMLK
jgi:hypothetical protein